MGSFKFLSFLTSKTHPRLPYQNPIRQNLVDKPESQNAPNRVFRFLRRLMSGGDCFVCLNQIVNSWFGFWSCFRFGFVFWFGNVQELLMGGRGQRQRRRFTLGYTPWRNPIRIWFMSMFDPPKEVSVFNCST